MIMIDFNKFKIELKEATKVSFLKISNTQNLYAFGLLSDENCQTILPVANTLDYLQKSREDYDDLDSMLCKFEPDEWDFDLLNNETLFKPLNKILSEEDENNEKSLKEFELFQNKFYDTCIQVLIELKEENFFLNNFNKDVFLIFSVSEYEFEINKLKEMIKELNTENYTNEYLDWISTWENE